MFQNTVPERSCTEGTLRSQERYFRLLLQNIEDGIMVLEEDGGVRFANSPLERILGFVPEEIRGVTLFEHICPEDLSMVTEALERAARAPGSAQRFKARFRHRNGSMRVLEAIGSSRLDDPEIAGIVISLRDVTERTRAEEALREGTWTGNPTLLTRDGGEVGVSQVTIAHRSTTEAVEHLSTIIGDTTEHTRAQAKLRKSEAKHRLLFETMLQGVIFHDSEGRILSANPAAERILGLNFAPLQHRTCVWQAVREDGTEFPGEEQPVMEALQTGKGVSNVVMGIPNPETGEYRWVNVHAIPLFRLGEAEPYQVYTILDDVTERRRLEEELRQAQKMEAVGRLAGGVAHDFNNLLTAIKGNTQMLLMDVPKGSPLREDLEEIDKAANRATSLTQQLLTFSRKEVIRPRILDLNAVISDTEKMLRRLLREDIQFATRLDPHLGQVRADLGQIEQVLVNLAVNARDAMPCGGKFVVETQNVGYVQERTFQHGDVKPGPYVLLAVSDTGEGMSREVQERVFEPFFTTKQQGKGTGLGLSTVYGIVKQGGGDIWIDSEVGRGTTFKIYLPRVTEAISEEEMVEPSAPRYERFETILLVEDEPAVRSVTRRGLERIGYTVLEARSGEEALRVCQAHEESIHLLITDVVLPYMGGRELAERVGELCPGIRVLFMSGYTDEAISHRGVLDSGVEFIHKPFTPDALARKADDLVRASGARVVNLTRREE
jgi:two-component system cell cycle sensor histidine kinase/response regulator CckA